MTTSFARPFANVFVMPQFPSAAMARCGAVTVRTVSSPARFSPRVMIQTIRTVRQMAIDSRQTAEGLDGPWIAPGRVRA
jgi:hypothetical protein